MWWTVLTVVATAGHVHPHACLGRESAIAMLGRWRPQIVANYLVSMSGVKRYAHARIQLECKNEGVVALVDADVNLYVVSAPHNGAHGTTELRSVLWATRDPGHKVECFRRLRAWHAHHFPDAALSAHLLRNDTTDRNLWEVSFLGGE